MKLIGLTGHKGAGKDEVAKLLAEHGYERIALADPLKAIATVIGWDGDKSEKLPCHHCGMLQGRQLLQVLGTEGVREHISSEAWLTAAERLLGQHERVVVADIRFLNEATWVRRLGGRIWRVLRPGYHGDGHASEREQDAIRADLSLLNDTTLEHLAMAVRVGLSSH